MTSPCVLRFYIPYNLIARDVSKLSTNLKYVIGEA